ncbi:hypothetical protein MJG53_004350 [Ovis ammon polii x Ovis aries]|uniref:Uncharacterized protein n=1 Tax=Ovis ammon polii x Ovis aries TaxID=2918886 RepID=A0ACB9V9R0_9CETA|nr:hypothetical protein MJG53_004350 [Ovis ammon polii x Ovis aries]
MVHYSGPAPWSLSELQDILCFRLCLFDKGYHFARYIKLLGANLGLASEIHDKHIEKQTVFLQECDCPSSEQVRERTALRAVSSLYQDQPKKRNDSRTIANPKGPLWPKAPSCLLKLSWKLDLMSTPALLAYIHHLQEGQQEGSDLKSGVQYFMADYKAESRELDKTFSDSYYLLDEPKPYFQIHFPYDFPVGYVLDAARSWQNKEQEAKPRGENEHVQFEKLEVQYGWSVATPTLDR